MSSLGSHWVIRYTIIAALLALSASADYFTNPASFVTADNGTEVKTQDLSTVFTMGQTVQITWSTSIAYISLALAHWDVDSGVVLTAFMTNDPNTGFYTWTIGTNDNINDAELATSPNFEMRLTDPTGTNTSTGHPLGFIDHTLTSRGFVIKSNTTSSNSTSSSTSPTSSPTASASSKTVSPTSGVAPATPTASPTTSGLSTGAKVGVAVGGAAAVLAIITALIFAFRSRHRRKQHGIQTQQANREDATGKEPWGKAELGAPLHAQPRYGELSGSTSYRHVPTAELSTERYQ